jgi:protein-S-isoprenylcysteine O-methyltransferase Ste14
LTAVGANVRAEIVDSVVIACWLGILAILVVGKHGAAPGAQHNDSKSMRGMWLQVAAYLICFAALRPVSSPPLRLPRTGETVLDACTAALALLSTWFCYAAARALGRHWALVARVIRGHELVRSGPYAIVRHPIYLAMLGVLTATGLAFSRWPALPLAIVTYLAGTALRIRAEERLLRAAFGAEFEDYAGHVPALLPRLRREGT